jgi:hypothetical protein
MATLSRRLYVYSDGTWEVEESIATLAVQYYMQKEDASMPNWNWGVRPCAPCPAVFVMKEDSHAFVNQQHQYYLRAANYNMDLEDVYLLLDKALAFANGTGFRDSTDPRADYFHNKDLQHRPPQYDKVRTMSRSVMTGTEQFSLVQALYDAVFLARAISRRRTSFLAARNAFTGLLARSENVLNVDVLDSGSLPPLKPGYSYPGDISEVDPNAYLYMPQTHPEKFMVANVVARDGRVVQFPRGATYPWIDDGLTPYNFVPYTANLAYGPVLYPMRFLVKIPLGDPKPRAYHP